MSLYCYEPSPFFLLYYFELISLICSEIVQSCGNQASTKAATLAATNAEMTTNRAAIHTRTSNHRPSAGSQPQSPSYPGRADGCTRHRFFVSSVDLQNHRRCLISKINNGGSRRLWNCLQCDAGCRLQPRDIQPCKMHRSGWFTGREPRR
jgi:hypothetical protein